MGVGVGSGGADGREAGGAGGEGAGDKPLAAPLSHAPVPKLLPWRGGRARGEGPWTRGHTGSETRRLWLRPLLQPGEGEGAGPRLPRVWKVE